MLSSFRRYAAENTIPEAGNGRGVHRRDVDTSSLRCSFWRNFSRYPCQWPTATVNNPTGGIGADLGNHGRKLHNPKWEVTEWPVKETIGARELPSWSWASLTAPINFHEITWPEVRVIEAAVVPLDEFGMKACHAGHNCSCQSPRGGRHQRLKYYTGQAD
jgi:hypothetical protein